MGIASSSEGIGTASLTAFTLDYHGSRSLMLNTALACITRGHGCLQRKHALVEGVRDGPVEGPIRSQDTGGVGRRGLQGARGPNGNGTRRVRHHASDDLDHGGTYVSKAGRGNMPNAPAGIAILRYETFSHSCHSVRPQIPSQSYPYPCTTHCVSSTYESSLFLLSWLRIPFHSWMCGF